MKAAVERQGYKMTNYHWQPHSERGPDKAGRSTMAVEGEEWTALAAEGIHQASPIRRIKRALARQERVHKARVNLLAGLEAAAEMAAAVFGHRLHSWPWSRRVREALPKREAISLPQPGSLDDSSMSLWIARSSGSGRQVPSELRHTARRHLL
jgi:hypothetical protein